MARDYWRAIRQHWITTSTGVAAGLITLALAGLDTRAWVIAALIAIVSLASAQFLAWRDLYIKHRQLFDENRFGLTLHHIDGRLAVARDSPPDLPRDGAFQPVLVFQSGLPFTVDYEIVDIRCVTNGVAAPTNYVSTSGRILPHGQAQFFLAATEVTLTVPTRDRPHILESDLQFTLRWGPPNADRTTWDQQPLNGLLHGFEGPAGFATVWLTRDR